MTQINPYLRFDGKCGEAMTFYQHCLGGGLSLTTVAESPMAKQMPAELQQQIMHSNLNRGNMTLQGSDMVGPEGLTKGNSFALTLECETEEELRSTFSKLSEGGGKILFPISPSFWGGLYGQLIDRYGNAWMVNFQKRE